MANDIPSSAPPPPGPPAPLDFDAARMHAITLGLSASAAQRIAWLEEVLAIAHASGALPRRSAGE